MINPILSAINETLDGYVKTYCLLERSESNKTIEYSGGGSFNTIPFDTYKVGGYWRLRSNVSFTESAGVVACTKKQTITYPLYFVAWFRRDEVEDYDQFAQLTAGTISTLRTPSVRTQVRGYNIDQQQSETGKINDDWMVIRFDVDVVFTKICPTTCATIEPFCKLLGSINSVEIGEFFSDFNILVVNQDGEQTGAWNEETQRWEVVTGGGGGDVTLQVNGSPFTVITAPDTFDLPVLQDGSPVGSKVGDNWVIPSCPTPDTTVNIQSVLAGTTPYGDPVNVVLRRSDGSLLTIQFSVVSTNPYIVELTNIGVRINGISTLVGFLANSGLNIRIHDPSGTAIPYLSTTQDSGIMGTVVLAWVALSITGSGGTIAWANYINGDAPDIDIVDSADNPVAITKISDTKLQIDDLPCAVPMTVDFEADDVTPNVGDTVNFTDLSTGTPDYWCWRFGVNMSAFTQNPTYTAAFAGHKDVVLLAGESQTLGGREPKSDYLAVGGIVDKYPTNNILSTGVNLQVLAYENTAIMTVRRADATTQNFLSVNGILSKTELETFSGGQRCTVTNWKQQDGSGREWVQAATGSQPEIVDSSGNCRVAQNGYPAPYFDGVDDYMEMAYFDYFGAGISALYACIVVQNVNGQPNNPHIISQYATSTNDRVWRFAMASTSGNEPLSSYTSNGLTAQTITYPVVTQNTLDVYGIQINTALATANRIKIYRNVSELSSGSVSGDVSGNLHNPSVNSTRLLLGAVDIGGSASNFLNGYIQMASVWTGVQANRADIEQCTYNALSPLA